MCKPFQHFIFNMLYNVLYDMFERFALGLSVLPTFCKAFERIMQKQVIDYIEKFLPPFLCGYRKGFSTQYALLPLIETWRLCLDKQSLAGALLMDLSKAFDAINHELLIAKLHVYRFSIEALKVLLSYLQER